MDTYTVRPVTSPIHWEVTVPGSKSITNRALLMAALQDGPCHLKGVLFSDDSRCFLGSLKSLGYEVKEDETGHEVWMQGCGGRLPVAEGQIYVGSAGTAARFLTAMLGVSKGTFLIQCSEQMAKRPMKPLFELLKELGASVEWLGETWHLPVRMTGANLPEKNEEMTEVSLDISKSTQFLSALLLIAPLFPFGLKIHITSAKKDGSYIRITRKMMESCDIAVHFDGNDYTIEPHSAYRMQEYQVEPDVSAACYFYGAAAITGGYAKVKQVFSDSMQGDMKFLGILEQMGCRITEEADGISLVGPKAGTLKGIEINMNDFSDQALTLAAIAPYTLTGVSMRGIGHIRGQECDRIHAMVSNLTEAGILCEEEKDAVRIHAGIPRACRIQTYEDHRVAMAFSLLGLRTKGIVIENPLCCRKTFEDYFTVFDGLTAHNGPSISL